MTFDFPKWANWGRIGRPRLSAWSRFMRAVMLGRERRAPADESLLDWGRQLLPDHFRLPPSAMHLWLDEQLAELRRARGVKLNVIGPRGGAKSTLVTLAYVLRAALEGWEPYIWIVSDTRQQACGHLENVRGEISQNRLLAERYPQACAPGKVWRAAAIQLANRTRIEAYGVGQPVRGRRRGQHRPTLIVCDDVQSDRHMLSAIERQRSRAWFEGTLLKAGTRRTHLVSLATALHRDALALQLARTPGWTTRTFRAIERWPSDMLLWQQWESIYGALDDADRRQHAREFFEQHRAAMEQGAELLWPEEEDLYTLMTMRVDGGRVAFEREKQGSPANPDLYEWPDSYFDGAIWFDEWPPLVVRAIALDPSKGADARHGDYSAFVVAGLAADDRLYVQADLARRPIAQIVADGVELCRQFKPDAIAIEANQFQELLGDQFAAEFRRQGLLSLAPWSIDNRVNKQVRIRRLGSYLAQGRFRFKADSPATALLVDQLREFPAGQHDDGPDALEMALRLIDELMQSRAA